MKIVIVGVADWSERLKTRLGAGFTVVDAEPSDRERMARELRDAEVVISGKFTAQTAVWCRSLKLLICPWAGTDNIDRSVLPTGARFVNSGGTEQPIAEHVIAVLVALRRNCSTPIANCGKEFGRTVIGAARWWTRCMARRLA